MKNKIILKELQQGKIKPQQKKEKKKKKWGWATSQKERSLTKYKE